MVNKPIYILWWDGMSLTIQVERKKYVQMYPERMGKYSYRKGDHGLSFIEIPKENTIYIKSPKT